MPRGTNLNSLETAYRQNEISPKQKIMVGYPDGREDTVAIVKDYGAGPVVLKLPLPRTGSVMPNVLVDFNSWRTTG